VDVFAPGVELLAAAPRGRYAGFSGTSAAAPLAAGAVALLASARPELDGAQLRALLVASAQPRPGLVSVSGGRRDAAGALAAAGVSAPAPAPALGGLRWSAPTVGRPEVIELRHGRLRRIVRVGAHEPRSRPAWSRPRTTSCDPLPRRHNRSAPHRGPAPGRQPQALGSYAPSEGEERSGMG
jgi:hypothetical protein